MKKKIILLVIIALLISGGVLGVEVIKISIEQANTLAITNNPYVAIDELRYDAAVISYDEANRIASITEKTTYKGQIKGVYTPFNEETTLTLIVMNNNKNIKNIEKDILNVSYDYYLFESSLYLANETFLKAKSDYLEILATSDSIELEKMNGEYLVESSRIALENAENEFAAIGKRLKSMLPDNKIIDINLIDIINPYDLTYEEVYESAMTNHITLYSSSRNMESKEIYFNIISQFYGETTEKHITAKANYEQALLDYNKQLLSVEVSILRDINNLKTKYDYLQLEKLNQQIKLEDYEIALTQYEQGFISLNILQGKEKTYKVVVSLVSQKEKTYILALKDLEISTGYIR
ncbi:MAG: hypothetical protein KAG94_03230 [Clostridiales bacterium]|nr:hypothetical protein [Clostridiales bacterium]